MVCKIAQSQCLRILPLGLSQEQGTPPYTQYIQVVNIVIKMIYDKENFPN